MSKGDAPAIIRGLKIASLGLLDTRQVLENKQIIKSLRKITKRSSIFLKQFYIYSYIYISISISIYLSLIYEETSFVCLRKFRTLWAVSAKYVTLLILGNEVKSSQNALHYIRNSFLFRCFREWILNG